VTYANLVKRRMVYRQNTYPTRATVDFVQIKQMLVITQLAWKCVRQFW